MGVSAAFHNRKPLYRNDFEPARDFFRKFLPAKKPLIQGKFGRNRQFQGFA